MYFDKNIFLNEYAIDKEAQSGCDIDAIELVELCTVWQVFY